jgi:hypothetical protein
VPVLIPFDTTMRTVEWLCQFVPPGYKKLVSGFERGLWWGVLWEETFSKLSMMQETKIGSNLNT